MRSLFLLAFVCQIAIHATAADHVAVTSKELIDLNAHFPFSPPTTREAWELRAQQVRDQVKVSLALHPTIDLPTPQPTIYGKRNMAGYSIEKIYLESLPGLYVTGSLYRPAGDAASQAKHPAGVYAHGHWNHGRFYEASAAEVKGLLATGAERFENAAINHMQAACVQLARMGCVVLQWDMLGYADSQQLSFDRVHRYGLAGANLASTAEGWPLYSPQAEMWGQSVMALQTLNAIAAYRMLAGLPYVDAAKVVITGASGGGTQSFITAAVLPELRGAMPAVMVSTGMQGGCTCENACGLRVGTGNVEIAATIAPRPLSMTAADDWTKNMATDGFPELQQLFGLYGAKDAVRLHQGIHFPHNYNHVARVALYSFVNRVFNLQQGEPILEADFERLDKAALTVWDNEHPQPASGEAFERRLLKQWTELSKQALGESTQTVAPEKIADIALGWEVLLRPSLYPTAAIQLTVGPSDSQAIVTVTHGELEAGRIVRLPSNDTASQLTLQLSDDSLASLVAGDPLAELGPHQPLVNQPSPAAPYTFGYNAPQLVRRTAVALALLDAMQLKGSDKVTLKAAGDDAFVALAVACQRPTQVAEVQLSKQEIEGFFDKVDSIDAPRFLPHASRYLGLGGLAAVVRAKGVALKLSE